MPKYSSLIVTSSTAHFPLFQARARVAAIDIDNAERSSKSGVFAITAVTSSPNQPGEPDNRGADRRFAPDAPGEGERKLDRSVKKEERGVARATFALARARAPATS